MLKIVATIHDAGMAVNVGGSVSSRSEIIEIPTSKIPCNVMRYLENRNKEKTTEKYYTYQTLTFSLLEEDL